MKVKLHTISASPSGCADSGEPVTLSDDEGKRLIATGTAQIHTTAQVSDVASAALVEEQARKLDEARLREKEIREAEGKSLASVTAALNSLDPADDDDWTSGGKPAMDRLKTLTGSTTLTRAEVVALVPEFKRPVATEAAKPAAQPAAASSGPRSNKP